MVNQLLQGLLIIILLALATPSIFNTGLKELLTETLIIFINLVLIQFDEKNKTMIPIIQIQWILIGLNQCESKNNYIQYLGINLYFFVMIYWTAICDQLLLHISISFLNIGMAELIEILPSNRQWRVIQHCQFHYGWFHDDARNQGISSRGDDLVYWNIPVLAPERLSLVTLKCTGLSRIKLKVRSVCALKENLCTEIT